MAFGLTIGTERATALQNAVQDELIKRGYSLDADPVMAEYITIMVINNKAPAQITLELEDLIGSDFDSSFTDWLFAKAASGIPEPETATSTPVPVPAPPSAPAPESKPSTQPDLSRRPLNAPRTSAPPFEPTVSSSLSLSTASPTSQKRSTSARSPSPTGHGPAKARRTDLPTGPRAMQNNPTSRSLLDRVGGRNGTTKFSRNDEIQARIDAVTASSPPDPAMMIPFQNGTINGMEMAMAPNPLMLQDMMMNQMALMAQMAATMGMLNPTTGQMMGMNGGFPMQQGDMDVYPAGMNGQAFGQSATSGRGRAGSSRGGRGRGGRGGLVGSSPPPATAPDAQVETAKPIIEIPSAPIAAPVPIPAQPTLAAAQALTAPPQRIPYALPERPLSPTLCKFGTKCTNSQCRFSHPSPVATAESGVVLSTEACEDGKQCKDKDCVKSHVSPAVNNPGAELQKPPSHPVQTHSAPPHPHSRGSPVLCRFGAACTRPGCTYTHPKPSVNQPCRFGTACTRAACSYQHPEGRVLPSTFHRGLASNAPVVTIATPAVGSIGAPSPHRSVTFNKGVASTESVKEKLEKQTKELEAQKKAVAEAEAAAAASGGKGESSTSIPIAV